MITQADPSMLQDLSLSVGELQTALQQAEIDLTTALADSFDTPKAMTIISGLIRAANTYKNKASANIAELEKVARWVTKIVGIFGLDANASPPYDGLGWAATPSKGITNPK